MACLGQVAAECLATFQQVAVRTSARHAGFVVECTEGLIVAAFDEPAAAALWALSVHHELLHMDWPPELLRHQVRSTTATCWAVQPAAGPQEHC